MSQSQAELPEEGGARPEEPPLKKKADRAWSSIARDLTPKDLSAPGAQKLLLDELERLSRENEMLAQVREQLHQEQLLTENLKGQVCTKTSIEIISMAMSNMGALLFGVAPLFLEKNFPFGASALALVGLALVIAGFASKRISHG